jgi:O-antigen/teichoic acid export membrane protein
MRSIGNGTAVTPSSSPFHLTSNALATLAIRLAQVGLEFACALIIARLFGAVSYGVFAFVTSCVSLLAIPATVGFDRYLLRETATLRARQQLDQLPGLVRIASLASASASLCLIALVVAAALILTNVRPEIASGLLVGCMALPFVAHARIRQAVIQGLGRVVIGQTPEALALPTTTGLVLGLFLSTPPDPRIPVVAFLVGVLFTCALGLVILRSAMPRTQLNAGTETEWLGPLRGALPFLLLLALNTLIAYADILIVGVIRGPEDAGAYRVASHMAMLIAFPLTAMNIAAAPLIARLFAEGQLTQLNDLARQAGIKVLLAAIGAFTVVMFFGEWALTLFGPGFDRAYPALSLLAIGYLVNACTGVSGYLLIMTGHEKAAIIAFSSGALVNVLGNILLVGRFGLIGAGVATAIGTVLLSTLLIAFTIKHLRINPTVLAPRTNARSSI